MPRILWTLFSGRGVDYHQHCSEKSSKKEFHDVFVCRDLTRPHFCLVMYVCYSNNSNSNDNSIIISYHVVDLKRQNRLKVRTNKPNLKVKTQAVSDDDVRKRQGLKWAGTRRNPVPSALNILNLGSAC